MELRKREAFCMLTEIAMVLILPVAIIALG